LTAEPPDPLRVLIVEDHLALGNALRLAVDLQSGMECIGVAGTVADALALAADSHPDGVLMDVRLPDGDGIGATARLKDLWPSVCVIVLTAGADVGTLLRAAEAGAAGFFPKESRMAVILDGLRRAVAGEPVVAPSALQGLLAAARHQGPLETSRPGRELAPEERELLVLLAAGEDATAIASRQGTTLEACRARIATLAEGLGARSALEALVVAARRGLLTTP